MTKEELEQLIRHRRLLARESSVLSTTMGDGEQAGVSEAIADELGDIIRLIDESDITFKQSFEIYNEQTAT